MSGLGTGVARPCCATWPGTAWPLAGRVRAPGWLYPAAGALMAIFVASPAVPSDGLRSTITFGTALGFLALGVAHQRITGVRLGMGGPIALLVVVLTGITSLLLLSASYGLARLSPRWVIPPAVLAFAAIVVLGRWLERTQGARYAVAVEPRFNETIHAPLRLRICSLLRPVKEVDFAVLRDTLAISDASLSKHLRVLADAGFLTIAKAASSARSDARRLTWIKLTRTGRRAFDAHIAELRNIADAAAAPVGAVIPGR